VKDIITLTVWDCSACDGVHKVKFTKLDKPNEFGDYIGKCPKTNGKKSVLYMSEDN